MQRTAPPWGNSTANWRPWIRPISRWSEVGEDGCSGSPAKFRDVVGVAIQDRPTDASGRGRTGNLGQSSASNRLEDNRVRALRFIIGLNLLQDLRALSNRIVIRVNDANFRIQLARHLFR